MTAPILSFRSESVGGVRVDLDQLITTRLLIQANSGGGKSRMLRYILEQTHGRVQQIILDPEGEFASLREKFDYLLAGRDGDVPADSKTAKLLARRLLELNASAVLDLYDLDYEKRRHFVRLFLDELMHLPRALWRPVLVVIDEAHVFCPERGAGEAESTGSVISLCTQGRKRGFAALLATQRISKLHKDAAAELLNKLIGRTGLDVDLKRAGDELGMDKETRQQLRDLEPGEFYAFGPAISRSVLKVRSGPIVTTHPQPGKVAPPAPPPPTAVKKLVQQMQDLQHEAEEEARTIADLQRDLAKARGELKRAQRSTPAAALDPAVLERQIAAAVKREHDYLRSEHAKQIKHLRGQVVELSKRLSRIGGVAGQIVELTKVELPDLLVAPETNGHSAAPRSTALPKNSAEFRNRPVAAALPMAKARDASAATAGLTDSQQRILNAIATLESVGVDAPSRPAVGALAGYTNTSGGTFSQSVGELNRAGYVDIPAPRKVCLTEAGRAAAESRPQPLTLEELQNTWLSILDDSPARILRALIAAYPNAVSRPELGEQTGYTNTSGGTFSESVGKLVEMGAAVIPQKKHVRASDLVFPEGLE